MSRLLVNSGDEVPGLRQALDYLADEYGIPDTDIRSIDLRAEVDDIPRITVTLFMNAPSENGSWPPPALAARLREAGWTPPSITVSQAPAPEPLTRAEMAAEMGYKLAPSVLYACPVCGGCCLEHASAHLDEAYTCEEHWVTQVEPELCSCGRAMPHPPIGGAVLPCPGQS